MIQDIAPHQYHNEFTPRTVTGHDRILSYDARSVLVGLTDEGIQFPGMTSVRRFQKTMSSGRFPSMTYSSFFPKNPLLRRLDSTM